MLINCTHCSLITCCANWLSKFYSLLISSHSILNDFSFLSIHRAGLIWDFFLSRRLRGRDYYVHFYFCVLCILFFYIFILFQFFMVNRFDAIKPNKTILNAWLSNDSQLTNNHLKFRSNKIISVAEEWIGTNGSSLCLFVCTHRTHPNSHSLHSNLILKRFVCGSIYFELYTQMRVDLVGGKVIALIFLWCRCWSQMMMMMSLWSSRVLLHCIFQFMRSPFFSFVA